MFGVDITDLACQDYDDRDTRSRPGTALVLVIFADLIATLKSKPLMCCQHTS
jgi:hypothetical protein